MKREQDEAYRISLEADRAKVCTGGETPWDGNPLEFGMLCALCGAEDCLPSVVL